MKHSKRYGFLLYMVLQIGLIQSCKTYKNIAYFKDIPDSARTYIMNARYNQLLIHPDDILNISIQTMDPSVNGIFSQALSSQNTASPTQNASPAMGTGASPTGFLVDKNGVVELPVLGDFKLAGMTTMQARDTIEKIASQFYKNPIVYVRLANLKVTVLGEVAHPGTYILPNEKNTIFDALGLAGDMTIFGKRENVLLMRDSSGATSLIRFNLTSKNLMQQDYFYLRQNDVLYIEPNKSKIASQDAVASRNYAIIVSVLTLLIVVASRINQ